MFPDVDGFDYWSNKSKEVEAIGCKVIVSDLLEKSATDEDRANKIDLADWIINQLTEKESKLKTDFTKMKFQDLTKKHPISVVLID